LTIPVASQGVFCQLCFGKKAENRIFIIPPLCPTSGGTSPLKIRGEHVETSRQATRNLLIERNFYPIFQQEAFLNMHPAWYNDKTRIREE